MSLSNDILRQILKEYDDRRRMEERAREDRQNEVYARLPEIKRIDDFCRIWNKPVRTAWRASSSPIPMNSTLPTIRSAYYESSSGTSNIGLTKPWKRILSV